MERHCRTRTTLGLDTIGISIRLTFMLEIRIKLKQEAEEIERTISGLKKPSKIMEFAKTVKAVGIAKAGQDLAKTAVAVAGDLARGKQPMVTEEVKNRRLVVCQNCPRFKHLTSQCEACGCYMPAKASLVRGHCPENRW